MTAITKEKQVLQLKVTLQNEALESWQGLSDIFKGANSPSIIRMALINYYQQLKSNSKKKTKSKTKNIQIAKKIAEENQDLNLPKDEIDEIMSDYWQEEILPGLQEFLAEKERN